MTVMTNEEKKALLLKDICGRLPYGIIASVRGSNEEFQHFHILGVKDSKVWVKNDILRVNGFDDVEVVKHYLRPMSSMTEEEEVEYDATFDTIHINGHYDSCMSYKSFDFLNRKMFDYRGLIEKGLALEAPEGMYGFKNK